MVQIVEESNKWQFQDFRNRQKLVRTSQYQ